MAAADRMEFGRTLMRLQDALPEEQLAQLQEKGQAMSLEGATDLALAAGSWPSSQV